MLDRRPFLVSLIVSCGKADVQNAWFSGFPFMAHNDLVSVTMVTYNSGRFIRRCLESVLDQDYHNYEVIVVDNASSDGTADILEQFEERCRIYYNQQNIGFAAAQNQAIGLSGGDWWKPRSGTNVSGQCVASCWPCLRTLRFPATRLSIPPAFSSIRCSATWI